LLGAEFITSFDDNTVEAKLCKANYEPVRDTVLEEHNWTFATQWRVLVAAANPAEGEFDKEYPLPSDVLTVLVVGEDYEHQENWQLENNAIRTNAAGKCQVLYRVTDPSKFSSMFIQALVARLAAEMAIPITNSRTLMETMYALYEQKISKAASRDSQQGKSRRIRSKWLNRARFSSGESVLGPYV
jgi:hypothetical protein